MRGCHVLIADKGVHVCVRSDMITNHCACLIIFMMRITKCVFAAIHVCAETVQLAVTSSFPAAAVMVYRLLLEN